jgi:hypothetical protein
MALPAKQVETPNCQENWDWLSTRIFSGTGTPNGRVQAPIGAIYLRRDGSTGQTLYVKEGGSTGATGWAAK